MNNNIVSINNIVEWINNELIELAHSFNLNEIHQLDDSDAVEISRALTTTRTAGDRGSDWRTNIHDPKLPYGFSVSAHNGVPWESKLLDCKWLSEPWLFLCGRINGQKFERCVRIIEII